MLRIPHFDAIVRPSDRRNGGVGSGQATDEFRQTALTGTVRAETGCMPPERKSGPGGGQLPFSRYAVSTAR